MANLSYNIVTVLLCVFVVASMMGEAIGREICHDVLAAPGDGKCDPQSCKHKCASKWNGAGFCVQSYANLHSCNCSWPCGGKE
ncbi:hypothetical protein E1A91_A04G075800v1 [Gossypium mustelinum]|uniref:Knottin scorpion toxin-like domain-containing protein n=1 Tax=Gossypium mustelinum TaxID=34275 RepID=A0A5D2ZMZ6_GOSMU|nr:hypothetical protein E1A91_A04G075800v1 [Gossypium mustelinum]